MASYPAAPVVFPARSDGTIDFAAFTNDVQAEVAALETALLGTVPHPVTLAAALTLPGVIAPPLLTADQHDYAPPGLGLVFRVRLQSDAAWTITGLAAQPLGRIVALQNVGTFTITLAHANAGSVATNRFLLPGNANVSLAANSSVLLLYDVSGSWRVVGWTSAPDTSVPLVIVNVPHNAANFTAATGTWTVTAGQQTCYSYALDEKKITVWLQLDATAVSSATGDLRVKLPAGIVAARFHRNPAQTINNHSIGTGLMFVTPGATFITLFAGPIAGASLGTWAATANGTWLLGTFAFTVQ